MRLVLPAGLTINNMNNFILLAIRAKALVCRVPTNPSLKAGVSNGLIGIGL